MTHKKLIDIQHETDPPYRIDNEYFSFKEQLEGKKGWEDNIVPFVYSTNYGKWGGKPPRCRVKKCEVAPRYHCRGKDMGIILCPGHLVMFAGIFGRGGEIGAIIDRIERVGTEGEQDE